MTRVVGEAPVNEGDHLACHIAGQHLDQQGHQPQHRQAKQPFQPDVLAQEFVQLSLQDVHGGSALAPEGTGTAPEAMPCGRLALRRHRSLTPFAPANGDGACVTPSRRDQERLRRYGGFQRGDGAISPPGASNGPGTPQGHPRPEAGRCRSLTTPTPRLHDAPSIPVAAPHPAPGRHDTPPRCADVPKDSRPPVSALPAASFMTRTAPPQERQAGATSGPMPAAGPAATGPKAMDEKKPLSVLIAQGRGMSMVAGGGFEPPTFGL